MPSACGTATIEEKDGRLSLTRGPETAPLEHFHYDVFRAVATAATQEWTPRPRMTFTAGASGRVESIAIPLEPTVADIVFKRRTTSTGTF